MMLSTSNKVKLLGHLLRNLGLEYLLELETLDPQYKCLKELGAKFSEGELALISVLGSIVAYRLSKRGEEYWRELTDYFLNIKVARDPSSIASTFMEFLRSSKTNRVLLKQKTHRIEKLVNRDFHKTLFHRFNEYSQDLFKLWSDLAVNLNADRKTKTIVFAVKMFYYAIRASHGNKILRVPLQIPIPVDLRVFRISHKLGLVRGRRFTQKQAKLVQETWQRVASVSGIAPLHIDVLLWMLGSLNEYKELLLRLAKKHKRVPIVMKIISMAK